MADDINIDDLLDATLDDLEDLPEFKPFPPGVHAALATLSIKEVNDKQAVELALKGQETLELSEPSKDTPIQAGHETSVLFKLNNEFGRGNMKKLLKPIGEALGLTVTREIIEQCKDMPVVVLTSYRKNKEDPTSPYMNVKELNVV